MCYSSNARWQVGIVLFFVVAVSCGFITPKAMAAECGCYFQDDCPEPKKQYCNRQSACTRRCVKGTQCTPSSKTAVGVTPQCDDDPELDGPGACYDDKPVPPVGTDGNGKQCDHATDAHKVCDGDCTWNPAKCPAEENSQDLGDSMDHWGLAFAIAGSGGGGEPNAGEVALAESFVESSGCQNDVRDVALTMAFVCLGDNFVNPSLSQPNGSIGDLSGPQNQCARDVLDMCRLGMREELLAPSSGAIASRLNMLSPTCRDYANGLHTHCQFPHPPEHGHPFPYVDGIACMADELEAAAFSLSPETIPAVSEWGLAVFTLLVLTAATIAMKNKSFAT